MDLEEIENEYSLDTTQANTFFLNGLKNKVNKKHLEKKFKDKLINAREKYYSRIRKYLAEHKYKKTQKKEKIDKKEGKKIYDYRKNFKDKLFYNLKILRFKIKISTRQIRDRKEIELISFKFKRFKVKIKHYYIEIKNKTEYLYGEISEKIIKLFLKTKDKMKKIYEKSKEKILIILEKFIELAKKILPKKKQEDKSLENTIN